MKYKSNRVFIIIEDIGRRTHKYYEYKFIKNIKCKYQKWVELLNLSTQRKEYFIESDFKNNFTKS